MELKVIQNYRGKYYLGSNEEQLAFAMGIYDENNQLIEVDGIKAKLEYMGDRDPFDSPFDNMASVFEECFNYAKSVISSIPYEKQALLFAKIYQENFEELNDKMTQKKKLELEKEIEKLQQRLKYLNGIDDISWEVNNEIQKRINLYSGWKNLAQKELEQVKEGTDKYNELLKRIEGHTKQIDYYNSSKL